MNPARFHPPTTPADARRAARDVFEETFSRIWLALARHDIPHHDRYDLAQDILLAALESSGRYDPTRGEASAWLHGIIHNHLLRYMDRRAKERRRFVPAEQGDEGASNETADTARDALELLLFDEKRALAHRLYREIPFEQLSVLIDHDLEELTLREIADQHGIAISTAHDRYNAALRKLQAALKRWEAKHRDRGVLVLPLAVDALLDADRVVPEAPEDVREAMWRHLSRAFVSAPSKADRRAREDDPDRPRASTPAHASERAGLADPMPGQAAKIAALSGAAGLLPILGAFVVGLAGGAALHAAVAGARAPDPREGAPPAVVVSPLPATPEAASAARVPASATPSAARSSAAPANTTRAGPVPMDSEALLREEAAFDTARAAFVQGNMAAALQALAIHARDFPRGQHAAERDTMWIDALLALGRKDEACKRIEGFHRAYPRSGSLPAMEARCRTKEGASW